jgi:hypothetical protein
MFDVRNSGRAMMVVLLVMTHIVLPLGALTAISFVGMDPLPWLSWTVLVSAGILLLCIAGYWGTVYWYFRTVLVVLLLVSIGFRMYTIDTGTSHFDLDPVMRISLAICLPTALFLFFEVVKALSARQYPVHPVRLAFPFGRGTYVISDGGNGAASRLMNYHFSFSGHSKMGTNRAMAYAVDIVQLAPIGAAAWNLFPGHNEGYPIFGRELLSPCEGTVGSLQDGIADNQPFGPKAYNIGNYITIRCDGFQVLLGHLKRSSIMVKVGDRVATGQPIAQVGNSGWTERPHLHMQAMSFDKPNLWENEGLPLLFDGTNPVKNTRFVLE